MIASTFHGAASFVTEDHDQLGSSRLGGKFHRAEDVFVFDIARDASDEDIADVLIENQLHGHAGIETRKDDGLRELSLRRRFHFGFGVFVVGGRAVHEAFVSSHEVGKNFIWLQGFLFFRGENGLGGGG